jgi:hypothetical protein
MNTEEQIRQANIDYREGRFEPRGRQTSAIHSKSQQVILKVVSTNIW